MCCLLNKVSVRTLNKWLCMANYVDGPRNAQPVAPVVQNAKSPRCPPFCAKPDSAKPYSAKLSVCSYTVTCICVCVCVCVCVLLLMDSCLKQINHSSSLSLSLSHTHTHTHTARTHAEENENTVKLNKTVY